MAHRPVGSGSSVAIASGAASTSSPFSVYSDTLRVVAVSAGVFVKIDSEPLSTSSDYYVPANSSATLALSPASQRVAGITTGATTIIDFPSGTGSPFDQGDYVSLNCPNQSFYNFTHKQVLSVNNTADVSGYFSTRITVNNNSSGIVTAFSDYGDMRKSLKVGTFGTGAGTLYYQQVQISGDA
jgi:hypothetical protein